MLEKLQSDKVYNEEWYFLSNNLVKLFKHLFKWLGINVAPAKGPALVSQKLAFERKSRTNLSLLNVDCILL